MSYDASKISALHDEISSGADPDWIRIQSGQWIRIQEGKNDLEK